MLSEDGHVSVTFLGTHPTLFSAAPPDSREVNYDETDKELARLLEMRSWLVLTLTFYIYSFIRLSAIIKQSQSSSTNIAPDSTNLGLRIDVNVNSQLELCRFEYIFKFLYI